MQSVSAAFTTEADDSVRSVVGNLLVSWKKDTNLSSRTFTIGVSSIGGVDIIGINPGSVGTPGIYRYFDESAYLQGLAYERGFNMPTGGLTKGYAEAELDNTSGRFLPHFMGGNSELHTAILPRRPFIINAGFNFGGVDQTIPQFAGILDRQPEVNQRSKTVKLHGSDYIDFLYNRKLDQEVMFTSKTTDQVMEDRLVSLGLSTSQYELDPGINVIPFGIFPKGTTYAEVFHQLAEAENGHFYQDENGILRFENRQHWDNAPYNEVQKVIYTAQVLDSYAPDEDHIINVVEVSSEIRKKQPEELIYRLSTPVALNASGNTTIFVEFEDPILEITTPSLWDANTLEDGSGTGLTINIHSIDKFSKAAKITFYNPSVAGFLTDLSIYGRPAKKIADLYYRAEDDSSKTAYEERVLTINNRFIQNPSWAESYSRMILEDFAEVENLQKIVILANPQLQLGDLISWQGRYWRIFDIKTTVHPSYGFIQELLLIQRAPARYFRIGISNIGGSDKIAP